MKKMTFEEAAARVMACQKLNPETGCHEWTAGKSKGYGVQSVAGRMVWAHRIAYEVANGAIDPLLFVLHRCDNPGCVNPDHLFLGSHADNIADKVRKDRSGFKLNISKVREIKRMLASGAYQKDIACIFGVARSLVSEIKGGSKWAHVSLETERI